MEDPREASKFRDLLNLTKRSRKKFEQIRLKFFEKSMISAPSCALEFSVLLSSEFKKEKRYSNKNKTDID